MEPTDEEVRRARRVRRLLLALTGLLILAPLVLLVVHLRRG